VFLIRGLLALHETTGEGRWLAEAVRLGDEMEVRLRAPEGGYYKSAANPRLLVRAKPVTDGALPSGNGIAVLVLLDLAERSGRGVYRQRAGAALGALGADLERRPGAMTSLALAARRLAASPEPEQVAQRQVAVAPAGRKRIEELAGSLVQAAVQAERSEGSGGWRPFVVRLAIGEGWHINANPASLDFLIPTEVSGRVRSVAYPKPERLRFSFADQELEVYRGQAKIRGEVEEAATVIELTFQACDDRRCLPPVTKRLALHEAEDG
jgi:hypothetical protein